MLEFDLPNWFIKGVLCALLGLSLIVGSVWSLTAKESLLQRAEKATGTVLEVQFLSWGGSAQIIVEFRDSTGVVHQVKTGTGGEMTSLRKGDSIELLYDPNDPSNIRSPRRFSYWFNSFVFFAFGVFFIVIAVRLWSTARDNNLGD